MGELSTHFREPSALIIAVSQSQRVRSIEGQAWTARLHPERAEATAEEIIQSELKRKGWTQANLAGLRKGDKFKVHIAQRLRAETTLTLGWIAERLCMGTRGYLSHLMYRCHRKKEAKESD